MADKKLKDKTCKNCGEKFTPWKPLQPVCSPLCEREYRDKKAKEKAEGKQPERRFHRKGQVIKVYSSTIAPVSEKRLKQLAKYRKLRKEFLSREENRFCPVMKHLKGINVKATEVHHLNGRENERLNDIEYWLAVSREGHRWIHENPKEARELGWLI